METDTDTETFEKVSPTPPGGGGAALGRQRLRRSLSAIPMLSLALSRFKDVLRGRGEGSSGPLLPVTVSYSQRFHCSVGPDLMSASPVSDYRAVAPISAIREEGLGWAEAGWRQPGVVVFVAPVAGMV